MNAVDLSGEIQVSSMSKYLLEAIKAEHKSFKYIYANYLKESQEILQSGKNEKVKIYIKYSTDFEMAKIKIAVLSVAFLEAVINTYLSFKFNEEIRETTENMKILDKWMVLPSLFLPHYKIDKGGQIYEDFNDLIRFRNQIIHHKPKLLVNGKKVHKGNMKPVKKDPCQLIDSWVSLPFRLLTELGVCDQTEALTMTLLTSGFEDKEYNLILRL